MARLLPFLLIFIASAALAVDATEVQTRVRALTRQLAADRLSDREQAQQQLLDMGTGILPILPDDKVRLPAEAKRRLEIIRRQLEVEKSRESTNGRRLSIKANAKALSSVISQLEQLSGNRVVDYRAMRRQRKIEIPISIDLNDVTFFQALDEILEKSGMEMYPYAVDVDGRPLKGIAFIASDRKQKPQQGTVDYEAGFRFQVTQMRAIRDYRDVDANGLAIHVETLWEPRLEPIQITLLRNTVTAVDQKGVSLTRKGGGESPLAINRTAPVFILPFRLPGEESQRIQTLSGELECLLPSDHAVFRFQELTAATPQRLEEAEVAVTLKSVRREKRAYDIEIFARLDDAEKPLESHLSGWMHRNAVYLEDAAGTRVEPLQIQKTTERDDGFGFVFRFIAPKKIEDYALVYSMPTSFISQRIPFRFTELELP